MEREREFAHAAPILPLFRCDTLPQNRLSRPSLQSLERHLQQQRCRSAQLKAGLHLAGSPARGSRGAMPILRFALATLLLCGTCQSYWANAQVAQDGDEWYPQHTSQQQAPQPEELPQQTPARKLAQQSSSPKSALTWHQGAAVAFSAVSETTIACCALCWAAAACPKPVHSFCRIDSNA